MLYKMIKGIILRNKMSLPFEKFYNDLFRNNFTLELSKHFYCSDESIVKIPKYVLQEKEKWFVYLIENNIVTLMSCLNNSDKLKSFEDLTFSKVSDSEFLKYDGPEKDVRIVISRVEYKKSNPMEDKIKMLQDQIDELKKQVIL
jgi:hypothetical protein